MVNFKLLISALALASTGAYAGYAQVSPPVSWSAGAGQAMYQFAANDVSFSNGVRSAATGALNVGGRTVIMPVAFRFAANAGTFLAKSAFPNPAVFVALGVAGAAYSYFLNSGVEVISNKWAKRDQLCTPAAPCYDYKGVWGGYTASQWYPDAATAGGALATWLTSSLYKVQFVSVQDSTYFVMRQAHVTTPNDWSNFTAQYQRQARPQSEVIKYLTEPELQAAVNNKPIPLGAPEGWPLAFPPLPVELPILNPSPSPANLPQPLRVPQGLPQPVPNSNPQQWKSPIIDIVPAPVSGDPWRVDVQPKDITKTDSSPLPESQPVPVTPPAGQTEAEKTPDLCEKNPDILACQKLDTPTEDTLEKKDKTVTVNPDSGWGASDAACPAPKSITVNGRLIQIPYDLFCQYMHGIRPVVISMAWLSAGFILLGVKGGD